MVQGRIKPVDLRVGSNGVAIVESVHAPGFRTGIRSERYHKVLVQQEGAADLIIDEAVHPLTAGTVACLPAGVRHQLADRAPGVLLVLGFGTGVLARPAWERAWRDAATPAVRQLGVALGLRINGLLRELLAERSADRPHADCLMAGRVLELVGLIGRAPVGDDDLRARVGAVVQAVREAPHEDWSLDLAARLARCSRRRFSTLVRELADSSFQHLVGEERLTRAAGLLASGRHSVTGAAFAVGFNDLSHFYRCFRRRFGVPPGQYRTEQALPGARLHG